jgi:hypothetical protein
MSGRTPREKASHINRLLELPVLVNALDGPFELLSKCLGEELLDRNVELLHEDDRETRINVVLLRISINVKRM